MKPLRVGLLSLEPWDEVWRRNQHFAARLVSSGIIKSLVFVSPPTGGLALRAREQFPLPGIRVLTPPLLVPRRYGGYRVLGWWLRQVLKKVDLLWINDPVAGVGALRAGMPAVYDVTDDWREMAQGQSQRKRLVAAEDELSRSAATVVCSNVLAARWARRYGVQAQVIQNGVDVTAIRAAQPQTLPGRTPHAVYVGTLHANRFDVDLVAQMAERWPGTIHLVGPDYLAPAAKEKLSSRGVVLHGPAPADQVPSWLISADVLICPHIVDDFTLSLDAIKSHEYLATDRPVVATPSCGFQSVSAPGLVVADRSGFVEATISTVGNGPIERDVAWDWGSRAIAFATVLQHLNSRVLSRA